MDHVHHLTVEKITKMLDRGLDPNFHDLESGGMKWINLLVENAHHC